MKISAAAILILCVVIDQKATVQGGFLDRFKIDLRGKDKTPDEALDGSAFSGGLSGNLKLPGNILSECSVGGNMNGNIGASTSEGIEGNVNAGVNLPSCDCIRKFDTQGSVGGGGSAGFGGFGVNGGASFSGSLAMPGMNCVESDNPPEEETDEKQDPPEEQEFSEDEDSPEEEEEESSEEEEEEEVDITTLPLCADLRRQDLQGSLGGTDTSSKVAPGNRNNDNVFEKISVIIPGVNCYEPEPPEEKSEESTEEPEESEESTEAPEVSEESTEALEESEKSEESTEEPEESEESTEATEESEESTEALKESEKSEESTEEPEESEESMEAPEESEESTEAPEESEESTEALKESEKSEESTEEPEESEESTEAPEESEESVESTKAPEESEEFEESTEEPEDAPEKNSYCYRIDIDRDIIMSPQNDFLTASPIENEDSPATFYQTMNMDNALQFYRAIISLDKKDIYDSKPEKKMTNVCDDSYPEGSIEANIWKIINLEVMGGEGCPVQKGTGHTFRQWLRRTELTFNEPLEYGNYTLYVDFDTPQGAWALKLGFDFVVDENSECTAGENFDESTEAPGESEESTEALKESEKSEESTEESEESTEAPEESEESVESTKAPEESEEFEESTEEPEDAPEKNSYCYRIDIDRDIIMSPQNDFLTASPIENEDSPATFYQTMNMDNALQFYRAIISLDKKDIYDSKPEKKMTNVCDDSYPEGSIEANIWKIINLEVMAGEGCPVPKGTGHTFRQWLRGTELMFNEPLEYGNYTLYADFDTPQGAWALKLGFDFVVDENSECTAGENFDESTEAPGDLEESEESEEESEQCYIVDVDVNVVKLPIFMEVLNKPMDKDNAFIINGAAVKTNDETIYDSKSEKEMTNACEDSYPEGSFQANIWHLFNLEILKGKGCPAEQGSINSFPSKLNDTQLKINKRLEPGEYYVNLDLSAPDGTWAGATYFNFMLDSPSECKEEGEPQEPVEDESNFNCYKVDIRRSSLLVPTNDFLKAPQVNGDITAIFYQTMDMNNPLQFYRADVFGNNKRIYGLEESEKQMKSACDDSYPEGSFEANIWKIFNLSIMNGQGCPVEEGNHTFIWWLRETELYFDDPLEYGNYTVHVDFDTPQGDWALGLYFDFVVNENSTCTNS